MTPPLFLYDGELTAPADVVLAGPEGHHAADVMRLSDGELVLLSDGAGRLAYTVVTATARGRVELLVERAESVPLPAQRFTVVQALARGGRDEAAVEAMTEVGVDEVLGWPAARSVARWTDRTLAKWESVARAATKQSRRAWLPAVTGPVSTADVVRRMASAAVAVVLDSDGGAALADVELPASGEVLVVVGPEGGITEAEQEQFAAAGAIAARLGRTVLRASTAGVAALSVLSAKSRWS